MTEAVAAFYLAADGKCEFACVCPYYYDTWRQCDVDLKRYCWLRDHFRNGEEKT